LYGNEYIVSLIKLIICLQTKLYVVQAQSMFSY
jgi:hypothetical protein